MARRLFALLVVGTTTLSFAGARANAPAPEIGVLNPEVAKVVSGTCAAESPFDTRYGVPSESDITFPSHVLPRNDVYKNNCVRLKIVFGPIVMKPGQNDVLIQPVTFEKPMYDGYLVRFKPDMVGAAAGFRSPRVKDAHLHHGTWVNVGRSYGSGPWIATGEEKTIVRWPEGYGLKVLGSDTWLFLHMIHNATAQPDVLYVTYDLDFIPAAAAEAINPDTGKPYVVNTQGRWLDVGDCSWDDSFQGASAQEKCQSGSFNPIFNAQRGFNGNWDASHHRFDTACVFPNENCAMIDTYARQSAQQGVDVSDKFGPVGDTIKVNEDGTLVLMGGHVHNGGLADNVYLVRNGEERLIHISDAYYFDHGINWSEPGVVQQLRTTASASKIGGPPTSWDFEMTLVSADLGWRIRVRKGDLIRLEGVYDTTMGSWYEEMGIVMTWFVPKADGWAGGAATWQDAVDPFAPGVAINLGVNARATQPGTIPGTYLPGTGFGSCTNGEIIDGKKQLCVRGQMTHPRIPTSGDHQTPVENPLTITGENPMVNIPMGAFGYGPADNGMIRGTGMIPTIKLGKKVTFWNLDTADNMWHTVTRCGSPCTAATTASYPIANGAWDDLLSADGVTSANRTVKNSRGEDVFVPAGSDVGDLLRLAGPDPMDFDSGQIGVGTGANQKLSWEWTPTRTGTFPFYCRIHPPMRGSIRVVA